MPTQFFTESDDVQLSLWQRTVSFLNRKLIPTIHIEDVGNAVNDDGVSISLFTARTDNIYWFGIAKDEAEARTFIKSVLKGTSTTQWMHVFGLKNNGVHESDLVVFGVEDKDEADKFADAYLDACDARSREERLRDRN
jgi:hypothetical protein